MVSYAFPPIASSGTFRVARFAKYLPEFGWRPIVVSPRPEHAIYNPVDPSLARLIPSDIVVERTSVFRPLVALRKWSRVFLPWRSDNGPAGVQTPVTGTVQWSRPVRDFFGSLVGTPDRHVGWILPAVKASLPLIRKYRPRVIFSSGPPHSAHLIAIILKRLTGLTVVCDLRDPWARNPWGTTSGFFQTRSQSLLERICVCRAHTVILNTENACREFESFYEGEDHAAFTVIPNGFDPALTSCVQPQTLSGNFAQSNGPVHLCHCGNVYGNRSLLPLVKAIEELKSLGRRFEFKQVGAVEANCELTAYLSEHDLESDVLLEGQLPHDQALANMAAVDILVVIQGGTDLQVPAKLFEMIPFRKPILALTGPGPTAEIVRKYELGTVVDPNDPNAIATAIKHLAAGSIDTVDRPGARQALCDYDGLRLTGKLADVLNNCVQESERECS